MRKIPVKSRVIISTSSDGQAQESVLDFKMPGMDGAEVAEVLFKEQPNVPVVVCSGFFDAVPEWLRWFAAAYVQKGDGPDALLSAIDEVIAKKKSPGRVCGTAGRVPEAPAA